jgi:predicted AAA+ superfamily ATPase
LINRHIYDFLLDWKKSKLRKPLILRGARQVGKTTIIRKLGSTYKTFLEFNLERSSDKGLFSTIGNLQQLIPILFLSRDAVYTKQAEVLIFIDEVQEMPEVIMALRYFYEDFPNLHVIVTGSLLEFALEDISRTPVGRVMYANLAPINFSEYLRATKHAMLAQQMDELVLDNNILDLLFPIYHMYATIGGMPEVVQAYLNGTDISNLSILYSGLLESYSGDVEKYATTNTELQIIKHILLSAPYTIDQRITFNKFGNSAFRTREVKSAFAKLEKARLLKLTFPTTSTIVPIYYEFSKSPKLTFLDAGLVNYQLGITQELMQVQDLNMAYRGSIVPQLVMQDLISMQVLENKPHSFWIREERGSSSEVDIVFPHKQYLIPIEIKSGATGTLRSLHEYMDRCPHHYAIRMYKGHLRIDDALTSKGKKYKLLSLPYFTGAWLEQYIDWFLETN